MDSMGARGDFDCAQRARARTNYFGKRAVTTLR